jgi:hypothetical protein
MVIHLPECNSVLRIGLHALLVSAKVTSTHRNGYGGTRSVAQRSNSKPKS